MKRSPSLTADELSVLCWQLSLLSRAGVPWTDSAQVLLEDPQPPRVQAVLQQLQTPLSQGEPLAAALAETGVFPSYLLRMTEIGQAAGRLDQVLAALADYYRAEAATAGAVRRAVTYPAVMAALIALIFLVLVVRVLPVFSQAFPQMGAEYAPVVASLLGSGTVGRLAAYGLAGLLLAGAAAILILFRGERGLRLFTRGNAAKSVARGRFASALVLMLRSGLSLDEAMERISQLLADSPLAPELTRCQACLEEGISFPQAVEKAGLLSGLQAGLLSAGFRAGAQEEALTELAQRCQDEAEDRLGRMLSRFEYSLVVVLCLAVGLVLLSVMLPLLGALSAIGR